MVNLSKSNDLSNRITISHRPLIPALSLQGLIEGGAKAIMVVPEDYIIMSVNVKTDKTAKSSPLLWPVLSVSLTQADWTYLTRIFPLTVRTYGQPSLV